MQDTWAIVFLGVIAVATLVMAALQVGVALFSVRAVRRLEQTVGQIQRDVQPLIGRATLVSEEAARVASTVSAQVERADAMLSDLGRRVDDTVTLVQSAVVTPAREGLALVAALRAVLTGLRGMRPPRQDGSRHEEEALFIG
jgi:hypothetical protein